MGRGLASLIMGLSLLIATASWAGFVMLRTVLDPGRSEALAETLLDNEEIREAIVQRLSDAVEAQVPPDVPVSRDTIETGAAIALDDPEVEAVIRDGLVTAHQNALNGVDEPVMIDAAALGRAGRAAVVDQRPELDEVLPATPELAVELPTAGLARLGAVKRFVERFTLLTALVSAVGVAIAFALARKKAAALRRIAFWAVGASAFWLAVGYGLPSLLDLVMGQSASIASAIVDVFVEAMRLPALILAGTGVALFAVSLIWPAFGRRRPAAKLDRSTRDAAQAPPSIATAARSSVAAQPAYRSQPYDEARPAARPSPPPAVPSSPDPAPAAGGDLDHTTEFPQVYSSGRREPSAAGPRPPSAPPVASPAPSSGRRVPPPPPSGPIGADVPSTGPQPARWSPGADTVIGSPAPAPAEPSHDAGRRVPPPPPGAAPATEVHRPTPATPSGYTPPGPADAGNGPGRSAGADPTVHAPGPVRRPSGSAGPTPSGGGIGSADHRPGFPPGDGDRPVADGRGWEQIDPEAAAADDDFGAEWVEGVGYVSDEADRR